ncbi:G5 domain-containing protein [Streptococcus mitis]|uniref:G5 domain-containing protein n=1 Tax=Streptococcus mitis TaxID=28037 RepID=UPI0039C062DF
MKDIFNKRQRFSIRKFSVGVASVLIGITLFTPSQGVLASTENNLATEIGVNSERENSTPTVEKKQEVQNSPENRGDLSRAPKDTPIGSTRTTEPERSGDKENNSLTTRDFVAGEDRSSTPAVRAASNPSEVKKYELTDEYAKQIKAGIIASEGNKIDSLLVNGPTLTPEGFTDNDYLKDKDEVYIYEKNGKKYVGYNSHPMLEDTDGDGIIDSKEKPDEKLKWNVSERDMIMFMELSYRDDNYIDRVLNHKKPLTESELYKKNGDSKPRYEYMMMNKELGPYWERKKSYHTSSGLDAVLYETKSDFSYLPNGTAQVLAFRGTSDVKDIKTDITLGTGRNPQQGIDAENIMRELAKDKSITNLYLTGHSLGGYLVQRAMVEAYELAYSDSRVMSPKEQLAYRNFYNNVLKKGTTFNAPKVVTSLVSGRDFWQKGLDSKKIAKSGKMTHYIVDNDSTIRKGVSNDSDVVINVGRTSGGHSSRSYFEADMINRRSEFISGKRISLDGTGYQDKKITTVKSVEKIGETAVYSKRGDDIIKSTTVSMKDPDTGQITKNTLDEVFKKDGAKSKVVVTPIQPSVRYEKDSTKSKGESNITTAGTPGTRTATTTYTVNSTDGNLIPHEGKPVIKPSTPTVVKVPAKDEVEYLKEGDDVVKKTTTYAVNASTGVLTPTEKKEIFKQNGAKSKVVVTPIQPSVRYEKDATKAKGESKITEAGTPGTRTVTTTYTVNPTDGNLIPHEGKPVIKPSTPTMVKVPAKDEVEYLKEGDDVVKKTTTYSVNASTGALTPTEKKEIFKQNGAKSKVVVTPIQPSIRYEKDTTRAKDESKITEAGTPGTRTVTTTYTVKPTDGSLIPYEGQPVIKPSTPIVVKVPAKDEVEYLKEGDNVVKKTTTYAVNASTGVLTPTEKKEVFKKDGAKAKVVVMSIEPSIRYEKDATRAKDEAKITEAGTPGTRTVTTTYTVNPTDGNLIPHEEPAVVVPSKPTVVKVPAKDEVEYLKEGDNIVKKTTTYEVNASTGALTPTVRKDIASPNGVKSKVVTKIIPITTRYEADKTKDVGTNTVTNNGSEGKIVTTTSTLVNETNGTVTDGTPVVSRTEMVPKVVKVAAKDKVVETPIEPEVEYVRDGEREVDTPNERVEGAKGKTVTTTTYDVDSKDGHITEHVGNPVVTPAGKTIVKVGAKTKVEQSKDSEGLDVIDTTTYEVDPQTGKVTPTTVRTYGKTKEPTTETRPVPSPVVYEKDDTKEKGTAPITVKGEGGEETITTTYTVDPNTGAITPTVGKPVRTKEPTETVVKVAAKDKVETTAIPSPKKYVKDDTRDKDQPNVEEAGQAGSSTTTTTYSVDSTTGAITERVGKPVVVNPTETIVKVAAKDKVVETPIEPEVEYVRDGEREVDTPNERVEGAKGKTVTTTTYDVDPNDGHITEHVGNPVVSPAGKTIVKVGAKTKVEQSKDSEGLDVIDTTTYEVDPKTGKVTPTTVRTYGKTKEPTVEKRVVPSPVVYEKDDTKEKGTAPTTVKGEDGEETITTTYTVDPNTGKITASEGQPVRTKEPTNTIVKVAAKDKVVENPIEPEVEYVRDDEREVDTPNERVEGAKGKTVTTTTYDVDSKDGHITEHVGNPVVTPAGKTIVKVGAKTKVEQSKDSEGLDVIDTTTYEVDPKTGKVTPTTVRTYGKTKEPTVEKRVVPSPVVYEKDDTKEKGTAPTTVKGEDGEDTITTTYTVDPNTGKITASEDQPVRTKEPTNTIVKVAAKDKVVETLIEPEVEYVKDVEKDFGTPAQRTEGEKGKTVTTTTYDVDPKDGHITEHVGNPVVTPAGKTIVKVGAKTKVEQSKDSEGRDVIDTITYEVDPKTGKVTPTTVRTYGITKEPKVELEQDPKTGDVTVTPKKPDGSTYPPGTTVEIPGKGNKPITVTIGEDGKGKVPNSELPEGKVPATGKITEPGKPAVEVPVENPAKVTIFENGVLPASIELPELMIEVRWIDEDGNVLKSSVKTGNEKDAEHGSIPGYEFVRTVIAENEPVMTHIFRKVSGTTNTIPVTPDTNGNSGHDTPEQTTPTPIPVVPVMPDANGNSGQDTAAPTTSVPDAVAPNADQVDTKTTNDNGAKSNDSQNVLPNTGTESNATLASLGLLGMLGSLGLALGKKKED